MRGVTAIRSGGPRGGAFGARAAAAIAAIPLLLLGPGALGQEPARRDGSVTRELRVTRLLLDVHVVDAKGHAIPGLRPQDFRVKVDGRDAEVEAVEWVGVESADDSVPAEVSTEPLDLDTRRALAERQAASPPGRVIVLFAQTDYQGQRVKGQMRLLKELDALLGSFRPEDRVAVLSFDSHLKLHQDFTGDLRRIREAATNTLWLGEPAEGPADDPLLSLAERITSSERRRAATVDRGVELVASALQEVPGAKSLLYLGWGFAINRSPTEYADHARAMNALRLARMSLFVLDVTDADYHTLETGLQITSDATGGTYQRTHEFPRLAIQRVARTLEGRYVLVVVTPVEGPADVTVKLARGVKGEVLAPTWTAGSPPLTRR